MTRPDQTVQIKIFERSPTVTTSRMKKLTISSRKVRLFLLALILCTASLAGVGLSSTSARAATYLGGIDLSSWCPYSEGVAQPVLLAWNVYSWKCNSPYGYPGWQPANQYGHDVRGA